MKTANRTIGKNRLFAEDPFEFIEATKPSLFPSQKEVIQKTGALRNLILSGAVVLLGSSMFFLPIDSKVRDIQAHVAAQKRVLVKSPLDGFVGEVFSNKGDFVQRGDLIMKLISNRDQSALKEAEFKVKIFEKELSLEILQEQIQRLHLDNVKRLRKMGSLDATALNEASLKVRSQEKRIDLLRLKLEQARAYFQYREAITHESEIRAPMDGLITTELDALKGIFVEKSSPLFSMENRDLVLEVQIKERDYSRILAGSKARVVFYAFPKKIYEGNVIRFEDFTGHAKAAGSEKTVRLLVKCGELPEGIQSGMSAKVSIAAAPKSYFEKFYHEAF